MKQTAVEWLREKLWQEFKFSFSDNILEQAKAMEKEQIIEAYESLEHRHGKNYYNKTYNK